MNEKNICCYKELIDYWLTLIQSKFESGDCSSQIHASQTISKTMCSLESEKSSRKVLKQDFKLCLHMLFASHFAWIKEFWRKYNKIEKQFYGKYKWKQIHCLKRTFNFHNIWFSVVGWNLVHKRVTKSAPFVTIWEVTSSKLTARSFQGCVFHLSLVWDGI